MIAPIQIRTEWAQLQMQRAQPIVAIDATAARVQVRTTPSRVQMDNSALDRATSRPSPAVFGRERAAQAQGDALAGIARRAAEGAQMMRIESGGEAIAQIARGKIGPSNSQADITLRMAPPPQVRVTPGGVDVTVSAPDLAMSLAQGSQQIDATRGKVHIDVRA